MPTGEKICSGQLGTGAKLHCRSDAGLLRTLSTVLRPELLAVFAQDRQGLDIVDVAASEALLGIDGDLIDGVQVVRVVDPAGSSRGLADSINMTVCSQEAPLPASPGSLEHSLFSPTASISSLQSVTWLAREIARSPMSLPASSISNTRSCMLRCA
jgi:hypothetical protein